MHAEEELYETAEAYYSGARGHSESAARLVNGDSPQQEPLAHVPAHPLQQRPQVVGCDAVTQRALSCARCG